MNKTTYDELIHKLEHWALERGLDAADSSKQLLKLMEEVGELTTGHNKRNTWQIKDSIGDIQVVLVVYCLQMGLDPLSCLDEAYQVIKDRKGKLINGIFIKDADLAEGTNG